MPWKQTSLEIEQVCFIERWRAGEVSFVDLCRQFGISRKTGYKRVERFKTWGWDGLGDRIRAPRRHPNKTPRGVAEQLVAARQALRPGARRSWWRGCEPRSQRGLGLRLARQVTS